MIKEKLQKLKDIIKSKKTEEGDNKKKIENLVVFIVILIITMVVINSILKTDKNKEDSKNTEKVLAKSSDTTQESTNSTYNNLEQRLENILQKIEGVGKVDVLITYSESSKTLAMYNEDNQKNDTEETDTSGGNRKVSQTTTKKEVIYQEVNGEKIPVTQSIINPKIEGAVIIAVGAKNTNVKTNIIQAVEAATRACNT